MHRHNKTYTLSMYLLAAALLLVSPAAVKAETPKQDYRHWGVVPLPILAYSPDTGGMFGLAAMFFYGPDVGVPEEERRGIPNNIAAINGIWTTTGSYVAAASTTNYLNELRYRWDNSLAVVYAPSLYFGTGPHANSEETYAEVRVGGETQFSFRVAPNLYAGPLFQWEEVTLQETEDDGILATGELTGSEERMVLSGPGVGIIRDTTGGAFWPSSGSVTATDIRFFSGPTGSTESFGLYRLQYGRYFPVRKDHVLAVQGRFRGSWGDVPFQNLPSIGGDGVMRGLLEGRYRDNVAAILQGEYRLPLSPGFAVVAFGSVGQVGKSVIDLQVNDLKGAGGIGFRVALNREQRLNLRIDIAFSPSGIAPYVNMGEAF